MSSKNFSKIEYDFVLPNITYLDNAATTFCPDKVVNKLNDYFTNYKANIHRGSHSLGIKATDEYESVRLKVARLVNAKTSKDVVFTSGTTHSINLIAFGFCNKWGPNDLVIVPESEHHANLLPWVKASEQFGFQFKTVNVIKDGSLDLGHLQELLDDSRGKVLFSMAHISNTIGYVQPVKVIFDLIKEFDGITVLDAAQSISKFDIDMNRDNIDFLAFSAHKLYGPTGVGVLVGRNKYLTKIDPLFWGGDMISSVHWGTISLNSIPYKLEAGTPNIGGVIGMGAAIDWFNEYDINDFNAHDLELGEYFVEQLSELDFIEIFHPGPKSGVISFNMTGHHPEDVAQLLNAQKIAVRNGFLCAQPIVEEKFVNGVVRASWACYNTKGDVDKLVAALNKLHGILDNRTRNKEVITDSK